MTKWQVTGREMLVPNNWNLILFNWGTSNNFESYCLVNSILRLVEHWHLDTGWHAWLRIRSSDALMLLDVPNPTHFLLPSLNFFPWSKYSFQPGHEEIYNLSPISLSQAVPGTVDHKSIVSTQTLSSSHAEWQMESKRKSGHFVIFEFVILQETISGFTCSTN